MVLKANPRAKKRSKTCLREKMLLSGYKLLFMYRDGALSLTVLRTRVQDLRATSTVVWYLGPGVNEIQGSDCILVSFFGVYHRRKTKYSGS